MKYFLILFSILLLGGSVNAQDLTQFNTFFNDKTMRIDYHHTGDAKTEIVSLDQIYVYGLWAGSRIHLIDNFNNGAYYVKIYDSASGKEIYSKGFDSYFKEYQTSEDAANGIIKAYHESGIIPEPKAPIRFTLNKRDREKVFPDKEFEEIPYEYGLYHCLFEFPSGPPKTHEHDNKPPQGFGIFFGDRLMVYYTYESNPSDGWADANVHNDPPEVREEALKFGANLIVWVLAN